MSEESRETENVVEEWRKILNNSGYEHHIFNNREYRKIQKPRLWKRVLKYIDFSSKSNLNAFEVGCGGGKHILSLALNGWKCVGIDCSKEVLKRAERYIGEASKISKKKFNINLICSDFLKFNTKEKFDMVFHVGVMEHYLDDNIRLVALKKMFELTKNNGYIIHIVPNGAHPKREIMRQSGLGGYNIPEMDYDCTLLANELSVSGGRDIIVLPHNLFSYILLEPTGLILSILRRIHYYIWQIIPISLLPKKFACKHAGTLIGIAKKSDSGVI